MDDQPWHIYIIRCSDGKLYTGISNNVEKRVATHNKGNGCRFTKYRCPVVLVYQEYCGSKSAAIRREIEVKGLTRTKKLELVSGEV